MSDAANVDAAPRSTPPVWWSVVAAAFILLVLVITFLGIEQPPVGEGTSYDASNKGYRAAYLLLDELGYPVTRSRRPAGGGVRWILGPQAKSESEKDLAPLIDWVARGGRALVGGDYRWDSPR